MNDCIIKVRGKLFEKVYEENNETVMKEILIDMLVETCEFLLCQKETNRK